jgi:hypothetical protein
MMYGPTTRRSIKIEPMQQRVTETGQRISYAFPSGRTYDLATLRMHVTASYEAHPLGPDSTIPSPCECIIETLEVCLGGMQLNTINNYGQLFAAWSRYMTPASEYGRRMVTSCGGDLIQAPDRTVSGAFKIVCNEWLGFLGSGAKVDTAARGTLSFDMTMASEATTGNRLHYETYITVDEVSGATGWSTIPYDDFRTSLTEFVDCAPYSVIQTSNEPGHLLQWVAATLLDTNYKDYGSVPDPNFGWSRGFQHTALTIDTYHFEFDYQRYTHEIRPEEFVDRLKDALRGEQNSMQMPHLVAMQNEDVRLEEMKDNMFLAAESVMDKPLPIGTVEVAFRTTALEPLTGWVLLIAKYAAVI